MCLCVSVVHPVVRTLCASRTHVQCSHVESCDNVWSRTHVQCSHVRSCDNVWSRTHVMYLMSIETCCRSRPSDTVYSSAGFDHTTGVSGEDLDINARHSADAARADRQDVLTKVSLFGLVSFGNK